jgi:hypothetical protein
LLNSVVEVSLDALTIGVTGGEHAVRQPRREYPATKTSTTGRAVGLRAPPRAAQSACLRGSFGHRIGHPDRRTDRRVPARWLERERLG